MPLGRTPEANGPITRFKCSLQCSLLSTLLYLPRHVRMLCSVPYAQEYILSTVCMHAKPAQNAQVSESTGMMPFPMPRDETKIMITGYLPSPFPPEKGLSNKKRCWQRSDSMSPPLHIMGKEGSHVLRTVFGAFSRSRQPLGWFRRNLPSHSHRQPKPPSSSVAQLPGPSSLESGSWPPGALAGHSKMLSWT